MQDQERESANFFENSIAILKIWRERQRDEMAHIKFIEAVVRAKSPISIGLFILANTGKGETVYLGTGEHIEAGSHETA